MAKFPRWKDEELIKLNEIVQNFKDIKTGEQSEVFWQKVSDEMKVNGFDRQAGASNAKWCRLSQGFQSRSKKKVTSDIWDVSDSDEAEEESYEGVESGSGSQNGVKEDALKPWSKGNDWSDEESQIAYQCIKSQRDKESALKLRPVTAEQLWHMVSDILVFHGFYRKHTNVCRYWKTKGKEKHNFDERNPSAIKASGEMIRVFGMKREQTPSKHAIWRDNPSNPITESSNEESFQEGNFKTEATLEDVTPLYISPEHLSTLEARYAKYNQLHNPVITELEQETGLSREQIKIWYRNQRVIDQEAELQREAKVQAGKELSENVLDKMEIGDAGSKRRLSDVGFQSEVEKKPTTKRLRLSLRSRSSMENGKKRASVDIQAQNEAFDRRPTASGTSATPKSDSAVSTIEVRHPTLQPVTQRGTPYQPYKLSTALKAERDMVQQKMFAAEEENRQLKFAIVAHKRKAKSELEAAKAKEQELMVQEEIQKKARKRIANIELLLDD